jgi:hypothetical protein
MLAEISRILPVFASSGTGSDLSVSFLTPGALGRPKPPAENEARDARAAGAAADRPISDTEFLSSGARIHIVHLSYHPTADQVAQSDAEFRAPRSPIGVAVRRARAGF